MDNVLIVLDDLEAFKAFFAELGMELDWKASTSPGLPVTQIPVGISPQGLPLGVQAAAGPGRDRVSIAIALALESALGGRTPPTPPHGPTTGTARRGR